MESRRFRRTPILAVTRRVLRKGAGPSEDPGETERPAVHVTRPLSSRPLARRYSADHRTRSERTRTGAESRARPSWPVQLRAQTFPTARRTAVVDPGSRRLDERLDRRPQTEVPTRFRCRVWCRICERA